MCTSISYRRNDHYFGRNLDVEDTYNEKVVITPREHLFQLKNGNDYYNKYAMIGIAMEVNDYPFYFDAANEKGVAMAGLNFPGNAYYPDPIDRTDNIAVFEFIPWILGQAENIQDVRELLSRMTLCNLTFTPGMPGAALHYMISDHNESIVVEPEADGLKIYDNPYDVMTNNPPFPYHLQNMNNYLNLSPKNGENTFSSKYPLNNYGVGMGAIGLPGDASSASRFVRAAFNLQNSNNEDTEDANVTQFFHVLDSVAMVKGATLTDDGKDDYTTYSCCINADKGIYYYKTYEDNQIHAVQLEKEDLNAKHLHVYELSKKQEIKYMN